MTTVEPLLLVGGGGHCKACIDVIEQTGTYTVAGVVERDRTPRPAVLGYPILGTDEDLPALILQYRNALVTIAHISNPDLRIRLYALLKSLGAVLPTVASAHARVSPHATLGEGTIVMHGAVVNAAARIGRNVILNSCSLVEHEVIIEDHCHIATGAVINGAATVGEGSFIGSGSIVREGLTLGRRCVVGMGVSLRHSKGDNAHVVERE